MQVYCCYKEKFYLVQLVLITEKTQNKTNSKCTSLEDNYEVLGVDTSTFCTKMEYF